MRVCVHAIGRSRARSAAGITWTLVIASAPWAGRDGHTSVIDAAGAIYVIGGSSGGTYEAVYYHDVWKSTDGGARPESVRSGRVVGGYSRGTPPGTPRGTPRGTTGVPWVLQRYYKGTRGVRWGIGGT